MEELYDLFQTKNRYTCSHLCPKIRAKSKFGSHVTSRPPRNFTRRQTRRYFGHRVDFCHPTTGPPSQLAVGPHPVLPFFATCNSLS